MPAILGRSGCIAMSDGLVVESRESVFWGVLGAALLCAVFASVLVIPYPFFGDQALFAVFARMMNEGSVLYLDIWDVKQPGIFWFFQLGGSLFGLNEIGIHLFESLYWLVSATLIAVATRSVFRRPWVAGLFPLLAPGLYFVMARTHDLTQVEALISPLVFGVIWFLTTKNDELGPTYRPAIAGVLAGLIMCFKLIAGVVPFLVVMTAAMITIYVGHRLGEVLRKLIVPFLVGTSIPLVGLLIWVVANDIVSEVWFTWFEFPRDAIGLAERPFGRLRLATLFYAPAFAPVGFLAPNPCRQAFRARSTPHLASDRRFCWRDRLDFDAALVGLLVPCLDRPIGSISFAGFGRSSGQVASTLGYRSHCVRYLGSARRARHRG